MKNNFLFFFIAYSFVSFAQDNKTNESLARFFAGIPLQESFEQWVKHVYASPYLGIDSTSKMGIYSSFKPGIKSYYPFPDSALVKMLFQKTVFYDSLTNVSTDSTNTIQIEGVFLNNKEGRKKSIQAFKALRKELNAYYRD